jgi:predicted component of type VI protein secretion system
MEAKLVVVAGKASKGAVELKLPTIIGRGHEAGLTIAHPMVSRQHCELFEDDGLLMIRDLGSTNGTLVAGRRIAVAPLLPDTQFTVGPLTFQAQYEYEGDPDLAPEPTFADEGQETVEEGEAPEFQVDEAAGAPVEFEEAAGDEELEFEEFLDEEETAPVPDAPPAVKGAKAKKPAPPDQPAAEAEPEELAEVELLAEPEVVEVEDGSEPGAKKPPPPAKSQAAAQPKPEPEPEPGGIDSFLGKL